MWKKSANSFRIAVSGTDSLWKTCGKIGWVFHRVFIPGLMHDEGRNLFQRNKGDWRKSCLLYDCFRSNYGFFHKISTVADILCNPLHLSIIHDEAKNRVSTYISTGLRQRNRVSQFGNPDR
ncbi:hypothetical protein [Microseira wollei]|uniref:hypothetical protein n=1 Tax=Microseira wollei TaxID=467598 RepID=UPI001CFEA4D9|nr:hypothetical protein [Microseira wollei]